MGSKGHFGFETKSEIRFGLSIRNHWSWSWGEDYDVEGTDINYFVCVCVCVCADLKAELDALVKEVVHLRAVVILINLDGVLVMRKQIIWGSRLYFCCKPFFQ